MRTPHRLASSRSNLESPGTSSFGIETAWTGRPRPTSRTRWGWRSS